jgi:hypothetical protein
MKNIIIILFIVFTVNFIQAQEKWMRTAQVDFIFPHTREYTYDPLNSGISVVELESSGFLLNSFGIQADYNYFIFKKLSIGLVSGFQMQTKPNYSVIKLGGVLRYFFTDQQGGFLYLQAANNFSLNKDQFRTGASVRAGLAFPILQKEDYQLNLGLLTEFTQLQLEGSIPLLGIPNENPKYLSFRSFGLSVGFIF